MDGRFRRNLVICSRKGEWLNPRFLSSPPVWDENWPGWVVFRAFGSGWNPRNRGGNSAARIEVSFLKVLQPPSTAPSQWSVSSKQGEEHAIARPISPDSNSAVVLS